MQKYSSEFGHLVEFVTLESIGTVFVFFLVYIAYARIGITTNYYYY